MKRKTVRPKQMSHDEGTNSGKEANRQLAFRTMSFNLSLISGVSQRLYCNICPSELRCQEKEARDHRDGREQHKKTAPMGLCLRDVSLINGPW